MNFFQGNPDYDSQPTRKRRQTMAEMLRESMLMGNTMALPDAVESAQQNAAKKLAAAEAAERAARAAAEAPAAPAPAASPAPADGDLTAAAPAARTGLNRYNLYARIRGRWTWQCDINAATHCDGMRQVIDWLKPEHESLPIRLEQDEAQATPQT